MITHTNKEFGFIKVNQEEDTLFLPLCDEFVKISEIFSSLTGELEQKSIPFFSNFDDVKNCNIYITDIKWIFTEGSDNKSPMFPLEELVWKKGVCVINLSHKHSSLRLYHIGIGHFDHNMLWFALVNIRKSALCDDFIVIKENAHRSSENSPQEVKPIGNEGSIYIV